MPELWRSTSGPRTRFAKVAALAERQWGVVGRRQLEGIGLGAATISRWLDDGRLHRHYTGVYAVGHRRLSTEGRLTAALLYAGPGALLSHVTAAWWWRLWGEEPRTVHVSVPIRRSSVEDVAVHGRRRLERAWRAGLPVTSVPLTLLDLATVVRLDDLRRAVAEAEYRRLVDLHSLATAAGRGLPGSDALRRALTRHQPQLALTRSVLEERFVALCESEGLPAPQVNARVCGLTVDALWARQSLVVELDGHAAHATATAFERDRRRDLRLRAAGYLVLRYTWRQVTAEPELVCADLRGALSAG